MNEDYSALSEQAFQHAYALDQATLVHLTDRPLGEIPTLLEAAEAVLQDREPDFDTWALWYAVGRAYAEMDAMSWRLEASQIIGLETLSDGLRVAEFRAADNALAARTLFRRMTPEQQQKLKEGFWEWPWVWDDSDEEPSYARGVRRNVGRRETQLAQTLVDVLAERDEAREVAGRLASEVGRERLAELGIEHRWMRDTRPPR